ncbi:hypothetical protein QYM36_017281 [Artemia franciscana]|uniref:Uncharacterized protein n=2 Tax=Artemia franciscana TaxID=6661 RepID=A0AA88KVK3_ARTSF|nr:hypothetical protein QYM36_017281 [Artemia franciscana]
MITVKMRLLELKNLVADEKYVLAFSQRSFQKPFSSKWVTNNSCGGTYKISNNHIKIFQSPNFPNSSPSSTSCVWNLSSTSNNEIHVMCFPFYLQCNESKGLEFLECGSDGINNTEYFCGSADILYKSKSENLTVTFKAAKAGYVRCRARVVEKKEDEVTIKPLATSSIGINTLLPGINISASNNMSCECGIRSKLRIVNGTPASPGDWPWQVMLRYGIKNDFGCGGALINHNWVLTAAHCVYNHGLTGPITVELGAYYRNPKISQNTFLTNAEKIILHEDYNAHTIDNDIALLKLSSPVTYTASIRPICLPINNDIWAYKNIQGTVTGWGALSEKGGLANKLMSLTLPILSTKECQPYFSKIRTPKITENMICTYSRGQDACQGDSGGPLSWENPNIKRTFLIGLVSWGVGCARENRPGVYTNVINYIPWIQKNTGVNFCLT